MGFGPTARKNINQMTKENISSFELMMFLGDIAYAYHDDNNWNRFFNMIEPVASMIPWMTCPGFIF